MFSVLSISLSCPNPNSKFNTDSTLSVKIKNDQHREVNRKAELHVV
jgi:hypothetical protein